jgi:Enoyl-CoA hydratase/isomerase
LNALSAALMGDLNAALEAFETDPAIGAIVLTGSGAPPDRLARSPLARPASPR